MKTAHVPISMENMYDTKNPKKFSRELSTLLSTQ